MPYRRGERPRNLLLGPAAGQEAVQPMRHQAGSTRIAGSRRFGVWYKGEVSEGSGSMPAFVSVLQRPRSEPKSSEGFGAVQLSG